MGGKMVVVVDRSEGAAKVEMRGKEWKGRERGW
jgi:hypothetical protein